MDAGENQPIKWLNGLMEPKKLNFVIIEMNVKELFKLLQDNHYKITRVSLHRPYRLDYGIEILWDVGIPDFVVYKGKEHFFVELKCSEGMITKNQINWMDNHSEEKIKS